MRRRSLLLIALILGCFLGAVGSGLFARTSGQTQSNPGRTPPAKRPESGLLGGKGPTTKPGSHESSAKDERDRIAGKFPAPKEKNSAEDERREAAAAGSLAYVDAVVLEAQRQAVTLTRDDFRVEIDGAPRRVVSIHYVFRGPQAPVAGRSIAVGKGVVARADEARTIIVAVDETSFPRGDERSLAPEIEHLLEVIGPVDRAALVALPEAGPVRFAGNRADLLEGVSHLVGRASAASGAPPASFDALARVLKDLVKLEGPKSVLFFSAGREERMRRVVENGEMPSSRLAGIVDLAAASRSVVHVVFSRQARVDPLESTDLHSLARSTGGTVTRLTGDARDLAPFAAVLLGGYLLEVEGRVTDRDQRAHALAVTIAGRGLHLLAATRWMPRSDRLPLLVVVVQTTAGKK
jgi:hypothetical protein